MDLPIDLDRFLPDWLDREPDNPFVAVFAPLVLKRDEDLRALAPRLWQAIQDAPLPGPIRHTLSEVLEFWLFERFRTLTAEEIWTMLHRLTPLEETRAYQSIFVKGEAKGKAKGKAEGKAEGKAKRKAEGKAEGKAEVIQRLLARRFGPLPLPNGSGGLPRPSSSSSCPQRRPSSWGASAWAGQAGVTERHRLRVSMGAGTGRQVPARGALSTASRARPACRSGRDSDAAVHRCP